MSSFTPAAASALPGPEWLRTRRVEAAGRFAGQALPTEAEEIWRYSRVSQIELDAYAPPADLEAPVTDGVPSALQPVIDAAGPLAGLVVVRNGPSCR